MAGFKGSGKTEAAKYFELNGYIRYGFADPLKRGLSAMFGWSLSNLNLNQKFKETVDTNLGFSPRKAMQTLGTEWGRGLHPDIWVRLATQFLINMRAENTRIEGVVIHDCRFENEAEWVLSCGGKVLWIDREGLESSAHASERGIPNDLITRIVLNHGDIQALYDNLASEL